MTTAFRLVASATVLETFVLLNRAVPIRVSKESRHISEVHNDKMCLAVLFSDTGSTTDDLLKGGHTLNRLVQNNQLCHFAISPGRKKLRSRSDNRIRTGYGDEIIKFGLAINIGTCNSDTVVRILLDHISVMVDEGDSHALGMIFGSAEHDGFLHPVGTFQILGNLPCNLINTVFENDAVVVVPVVVNTVFDLVAINVGLSFVRSPSVTDIGRNIDNLKGSQESIFDALLQTVNVNGISKVVYVRYFFALLGRCCHTDLGRRRKILQNFTPVAVFLGTSTMTLIHNNEVKVFCGDLSKVFFVVLSDHLVIERKVYFMGCDLTQAFLVGEVHFVNGLFKRCEVLQNALVNKNISVSQIQDSLFKVRTKQTIHDLESSICFARSRCHDKQQSLLSSGDCFNGSIYCISLIVAWRVCTLRRIIRLRNNFLFRIGNALATIQLSVISRHQFVLGREFI